MKISIITVCYNVADELRLTMNSVLKQGYSNIEYIVIDGGSDDGTIHIINKASSKIDFSLPIFRISANPSG